MISTATVQEAIVTKLKANAALTALVGDEIREEQWMGTDYEYPCCRIHVTRLAPEGPDGICEDVTFICDFSASYRAVNPSSKPTADGLAVVIAALISRKLEGTNFIGKGAVKLADAPGPIPEAENTWMARAFFNCRIKEV